ncbi:substrate-binding periplasmic protein [Pelagibius marinus]|uniref:substrate-binding periplasmic protein n=1 Tax=Pelagibius marinus TaxID=2762760 RepID=UPI001872F4F8|nr:transporter substrate-binding domain-containing protein [Pelagibius marinus]
MVRAAFFLCIILVMALAPGGTAWSRCESYVPGARPQNAGRDIVGQDLDQIRERGFIEFAVYEDFPPYSWEEGGRPRGIDVEVGRLVAAALGVLPRFRFVAAGETVEDDLRNYVWKGAVVGGRVSNVMLHVPYSSEFACRVEQVVLTGQYFNESVAIAYSRESYPDAAPLPAYFRFDTVGVENDSIADFYLSGLANGQLLKNTRRYPTPAAAMAALAGGEVKAVMGARSQLEFALTPKLALHQPPLPGFAVGRWTLGVAVRHNYRPLAYAVDDAIRALAEDGRLRRIFEDYGLSFARAQW